MRTLRWTIVAILSVVLCLWNVFHILAAQPRQAELPLDVTITIAQTEITVGAPMTWRITLTPQGQQCIGSIELQPGDVRVWAWPNDIKTAASLTNTLVLDMSAIPLASGDLYPILEVRYTFGRDTQTQLVVGDEPVHVQPVETHVEAGVVVGQGTVHNGDRVPVELWIRNSSPFTLTQVQIHGSGTDLEWEVPAGPIEVPAGETYSQVLHARVRGEHPHPGLSIQYAWTDATDTPHAQYLNVSGETLALAEATIKEPWSIIIGVLTGSLVALIPAWIRELLSRRHQEQANRRNVRGLLRLMVLQSEHAADNGIPVDLALLEAVFKEEGLYAIVDEDELAENARNLWKKAERHNTGLNQPGAVQRAKELHKAAQELAKKLDMSSTGDAG